MTVETRRRAAPVLLVALFAMALLAAMAMARPASATFGFCTQGAEVISFVPGTNLIVVGDQDNTDPNAAVGIQDGIFVSLGHGGVITLRFDQVVTDGAGADIDIEVYEIQAGDGATVEVSQDGTNFVLLGTITSALTSSFDLSTTGLSSVEFIRITDDNSGGADSPSAGFDLDAVEGFNCGEPPANPAIDIEKLTNSEDADTPTGPVVPVGSTVTWEYIVTNTGDVDLVNVAVTDDKIGAITCPSTTLAVGASMTCFANGTATEGQYANLGCVTAEDAAGTDVTDCDPSHYFGERARVGGEGCTPGYWKQKQHFDSWVGYTQNQDYETVFGVDASFTLTLLETLGQGGGGEKALGRHAVAALLNTANAGVEYLYSPAQVIAMVQQAYATGDFDGAKNLLEAQNEEGCPLN